LGKKAIFIALKEHGYERNSSFKITKNHYIVAAYLVQDVKLPVVDIRLFLLKYYLHKIDQQMSVDSVLAETDLMELANKTEGFSGRDLEDLVKQAYSFSIERSAQTIDSSDLFAALYYDDPDNLPNGTARANILKYYLNCEKTIKVNVSKDACSWLSDYTRDDFTGKELLEVVRDAVDKAQLRKSNYLNDKDLIIGLYKALLRKAKPHIVSTVENITVTPLSTQSDSSSSWHGSISTSSLLPIGISVSSPTTGQVHNTHEWVERNYHSEEITELSQKDTCEYLKHIVVGDTQNKKTRLDYRNMTFPTFRLRQVVIDYLLQYANHKLMQGEIDQLILVTEGLSFYTITEIINKAQTGSPIDFKRLSSVVKEYGINLQ
jgi:hypothetical protein